MRGRGAEEMRVLVGSANPVKIGRCGTPLSQLPRAVVEGIEASSGVPAQPVGDAEPLLARRTGRGRWWR